MSATDKSKHNIIPKHLGLILDGNRRWARDQGLPTLEGHRVGYENLKKMVLAAFDRGVEYVSAYVFSTENWNRSEREVKYLMDLALKLIGSDLDELNKEGVKVLVAGSRQRISPALVEAIDKAETTTAGNQRGTAVLCFNYGGQQEILDSVNRALSTGKTELELEDVETNLYAPEVPPLDLLIRTSGEQRISNFMLWRTAYAEMLFIDKHWPAFTAEDLDSALADYANRQRRFGK